MISAYEQIPPNDGATRRAYYLMKTYAKSAGLRTLDALIAAYRSRRRASPSATKNRKPLPDDRPI